MHFTAMKHGKLFFDTYLPQGQGKRIMDLGAQDVNGSLRQVAPAGSDYVGVDFEVAKGVDVVLDDPYFLPFADESFDVCVSSSCFEHSEFFWLVFNEILRVLKPQGLFYLNAPSNGHFHRYPVDCWRFYPDSGQALVRWAKRSGMNPVLLECFTGHQENDVWADYVAVFVKNAEQAHLFPMRMQDGYEVFTNGMVAGSTEVSRLEYVPEDIRKQIAPQALPTNPTEGSLR